MEGETEGRRGGGRSKGKQTKKQDRGSEREERNVSWFYVALKEERLVNVSLMVGACSDGNGLKADGLDYFYSGA